MTNNPIPQEQIAKELLALIKGQAKGNEALEKKLMEATVQMFVTLPFDGRSHG